MLNILKQPRMLAVWLLRIGLVFVFFYAAITSLSSPQDWIVFLPVWLKNLVPANILLSGFSFWELILGFSLLSGKFAFWSALLAALTIAGIIVSNSGISEIIFRDVAIFFSALALLALTKE